MRLFFALWPPPETAQALARWAGGLEGKATAVAKIHLTLAFLGDTQPEAVIAAAKSVSGPAFELPIDSARYVRRNEMIWVGPREMPAELRALARQLRPATEHREFAAHVTLVRKAKQPAALPELPVVKWPVKEFTLVRSNFVSYETLARFALQ